MKTLRLLFAAIFAMLQGGWAAEEMNPSDTKIKETLQAVVQKQLEAFWAGDYKAAYAFADAGIKAQFPVEAFEEMVKTGYPAIASSVSSTFGLTFDNGDEAVVHVRVVGADKVAAEYQYVLKRTGEKWGVAGVVKVKSEGIEV